MRHVLLATCFSLWACSPPAEDHTYNRGTVETTSVQITALNGGEAFSQDGKFTVEVEPNELEADATFTINQGVMSPAPAASISLAYEVRVTPASAVPAGFLARLRFAVLPSKIDDLGVSGVRIAHGDDVGDPIDGFLTATWMEEDGELVASTTHFSWFVALDYEGYTECSCDDSEGCDGGCDFCDLDCEEPDDDGGDGDGCGTVGSSSADCCLDDSDCDEGECCVDDGICVDESECEDEPDDDINDGEATPSPNYDACVEGECDGGQCVMDYCFVDCDVELEIDCDPGFVCMEGRCFKTCQDDLDCGGNDCCAPDEPVCVPADICEALGDGGDGGDGGDDDPIDPPPTSDHYDSCYPDDTCDPGEDCLDGYCFYPCSFSEDCNVGQICASGNYCLDICSDSNPCAGDDCCLEGSCYPSGWCVGIDPPDDGGGDDTPVPEAWTCDPSYWGDGYCDCGCTVKDVDCGEGQGCTAPDCYVATCEYCNPSGTCGG